MYHLPMQRVLVCLNFFLVKQKTAYEMRISDWSSDVCSSDLQAVPQPDFASLDSAPAKREGCSIHAALSPTRPVIPAKRAPSNSDCHPGQEIGRASCRESVCQYV